MADDNRPPPEEPLRLPRRIPGTGGLTPGQVRAGLLARAEPRQHRDRGQHGDPRQTESQAKQPRQNSNQAATAARAQDRPTSPSGCGPVVRCHGVHPELARSRQPRRCGGRYGSDVANRRARRLRLGPSVPNPPRTGPSPIPPQSSAVPSRPRRQRSPRRLPACCEQLRRLKSQRPLLPRLRRPRRQLREQSESPDPPRRPRQQPWPRQRQSNLQPPSPRSHRRLSRDHDRTGRKPRLSRDVELAANLASAATVELAATTPQRGRTARREKQRRASSNGGARSTGGARATSPALAALPSVAAASTVARSRRRARPRRDASSAASGHVARWPPGSPSVGAAPGSCRACRFDFAPPPVPVLGPAMTATGRPAAAALPSGPMRRIGAGLARRWQLAGLALAVVVMIGAVSALLASHRQPRPQGIAASAQAGRQRLASPSAVRSKAVRWVAAQVGRDVSVACNAAICAALAARGFPASRPDSPAADRAESERLAAGDCDR